MNLEIVEFSIGYIASALIGVALGLTGGGGSIVTVPILVYLFRIEPLLATGYSLFIVGATSLAGSVRSAIDGTVHFRKAIIFSVPATIAVFLTRHYILPHIPQVIWTTKAFFVSRDMVMMTLFAVTMFIVSIRMIRKNPNTKSISTGADDRHAKTTIVGVIVGFLSGIIGAGGGFLIVPALIEFEKLPIRQAIATSLVIIAFNSLVGFLGDLNLGGHIDMSFILTLSTLSIAGVLLGGYLSRFIAGENLKTGFGWFTMVMAGFVFYKELIVKFIH